VIYLDPDIVAYSGLTEVEGSNAEIMATPHLTEVDPRWPSVYENELRVLRHGICNLGFLALRNSGTAFDFLDWWERRLLYLCLDDPANGLFVDQKWFDLALGLFPVLLIRHPGYNIANWNGIARSVTIKSGGQLECAGNHPVRFIHFSGFASGRDLIAYNRIDREGAEVLIKLRDKYIEEVRKRSVHPIESWTYSSYHSGEHIELRSRRNWLFRPRTGTPELDPFSLSNREMMYYGEA
jgi:hypothetical protein